MSERNMRNEDKRYWRSITEFVNADKPNAQSRSATQEFPDNFDKPVGKGTPMTRRTFMGLLSASMAITATSCRKPDHKIISTRSSVEYLVPGLPNYYTSVFPFGTNPIGVLVKSREGRPVKIEGNDQHIASQGASSALMQASLLSLYDPDRMNGATVNNGYSTLDNALNKIADQVQKTIQEGKGVRIVHEEHASPSLKALTDTLQTAFPQVQFVQVSAFPTWNAAEANASAFGIDAEFAIDFEKADVILAVDSDILGTDKNAVYNTKQFSKRRKPTYENPDMSKLLVAEPTMTVTGINADHRARIAPSQIEAFLGAILASIGGSAQTVPANAETAAAAKEMAKYLTESGKQAVVTVGAHASVAAHSLAILINSRLNAYGEGKPINPMHQFAHSNSKKAAFEQFRTELSSGSIGTVIFADTNIFYYADSGLQKLLRQVPHKFTLSLTQDETALQSEIYVPTTHFLESWSDAVGFDGKISIQQPLIAPLNSASISIPDVILALGKKLGVPGFEAESYRDYVRARWEAEWTAAPVEAVLADEFERHWEAALRKGVYAAPSLTRVITWMPANEVALSEKIASGAQAGVPGSGMTLAVMPSNSLYDGKMTNNGWLLEVPDPVTKISWENVALISKNTADALGITLPALKDEQTEVVKVTTPAGTVELPAYIQPGMADNVVCIATGYGRTEGGKVLQNVGVNSFALKADFLGSPYVSATIEKTGSMRRIAMTQNHHSYEGRKIIQETTIQKVQAKEELFAAVKVPGRKEGEDRFTPPYSVMKDYQYRGHRWGMVIDLTACTGCNACVIACQAENNIPVVGKEQVIIGREMHWIRLDRYYAFKEGDTALANPEVVVQPMMCQHCENAPCENVCPVLATSHSPEGLNEMTYNRCVGTRYCLNNCPYKVRRFNYLKYHTDERTPLDMVFNPDVTVRMRGIMEKCTFCVQRITEAKHHAKDQGLSRVQDGMVVTACQQACPADAILFGDTNDENSKVAQTRKGERGYLVLEDLNVRPQVTYLAAVRNNA